MDRQTDAIPIHTCPQLVLFIAVAAAAAWPGQHCRQQQCVISSSSNNASSAAVAASLRAIDPASQQQFSLSLTLTLDKRLVEMRHTA